MRAHRERRVGDKRLLGSRHVISASWFDLIRFLVASGPAIYDTDMGGLLKPFEPGCSVSDGLGDFAHLVVCAQHWEPSGTSSWIEARGPGA